MNQAFYYVEFDFQVVEKEAIHRTMDEQVQERVCVTSQARQCPDGALMVQSCIPRKLPIRKHQVWTRMRFVTDQVASRSWQWHVQCS